MLPVKLEFNKDFLKEEIRCDYTITKQMKKVWAVELDLLNEFIQLCEHNDIKYYVIGGTLLGAVRHQGFIPWDDDIDVAIMRSDYDRLCEIAPSHFKHPYFFQTEELDYGFSHPFARLRNTETTAIPSYDADSKLKYNQGIWIDIFPIDNIPDNPLEKSKWIKEVQKNHLKIWALGRITLRYRTPFKRDSFLKKGRFIIGPVLKYLFERFHIPNPYLIKYERLARKYEGEKTKQCGLVWFYRENEWTFWDRSLFDEYELMPFENLSVRVPIGYNEVLEKQYGDWRKFVRNSSVHYNTIFDADNSYSYYYGNGKELKKLRIGESNQREGET